ncbi:MAG: hypothetical protein D6677_04955 [Calditrichaeota bacterium]|nr:MAG: hypothetical protein D6677_04955 [Calditrichota bacterium]
MIGVGGAFVIFFMASVTIGLCAAITIGMAGNTFQAGMSAGEWEKLCMFENGVFPASLIGQMAFFAV